jgi:hypothetical protein
MRGTSQQTYRHGDERIVAAGIAKAEDQGTGNDVRRGRGRKRSARGRVCERARARGTDRSGESEREIV